MLTKFKDFDLINENLTKARAVLRQAGVPQTDPRFVKLRNLLANNLGYIGKFTEWMIMDKISYDQLESLFNRIKDQRLTKPIDQFATPEEVIDSLIRKTTESDLNQMLRSIPSNTREFLEECEDFDSLKNFLTQNAAKKSNIIDFFSKKGGRYGEFDEDEVIDNIIQDLEKVVDAKSITEIGESVKNSDDVKFVLENEQMLILAVNYEGLQEVGSNYWCITQDDYTFSDYVLEQDEPHIQLVIYFKDKVPFVDDQSVLGVTWDLENKYISAAHWEDDAEYTQGRNDKITTLLKSINDQLFEVAVELYDLSDSNWFWETKALYVKKITQGIEEYKKTQKGDQLIGILNDYLSWCRDDDREFWEYSFLKYFTDTLKSQQIKIKINLEDTIYVVLWSIAQFQKSWLTKDIWNFVEDYINYHEVDNDLNKTLIWFKSNGYDFDTNCHSVHFAIILFRFGLISKQTILKNWSLSEIHEEKLLNDDLMMDLIQTVSENQPAEIIKVISRSKVKKQLIGLIIRSLVSQKNNQLLKMVLELEIDGKSILDNIDAHYKALVLKSEDPEIRMMAAYNLIPKEIKDLFDVGLTPKAPEVKKMTPPIPTKAPTKKKKK